MKFTLKTFFLLSLIYVFLPGVYAQSDSITFRRTDWQKKKIARGIILKQHWFDHNLFNASQNISILEIKMNRHNKIDVAGDAHALQPSSTFGKTYQAVAAVNGTFFDMKNGGSVDYLRIDGKMLDSTRIGKNGKRTFHQRSAIIIRGKSVSIESWNGVPNWEQGIVGEDVMVTGPLLLLKGESTLLDSINFNTARHPRTAVAIRGKKVFLITVDGRNESAAGMSLFELSKIVKWLNATEAINLDGGGSTTMWVQGEPGDGIINHPSDNVKMKASPTYKEGMDLDNLSADTKKWDHLGERPVANVLLVTRK